MPIEELLSSSQPSTISNVSLIFAHIRTALAISGGLEDGADTKVGVAFYRVTMTVLHNAQKIGAPSLWLAADARKTVEELLVNKGKITHQGALEIALGLRATSAGLDPGASLKSIAFNLGIRPVGDVGSEVEYDPLLHEYEEGGVYIGKIRTFLREKLKKLHVKAIQSDNSKNFSLKTRKASGLVHWVETGETLGRLATALGGASVAFGFEPDEASHQYIPKGTPL